MMYTPGEGGNCLIFSRRSEPPTGGAAPASEDDALDMRNLASTSPSCGPAPPREAPSNLTFYCRRLASTPHRRLFAVEPDCQALRAAAGLKELVQLDRDRLVATLAQGGGQLFAA